MARASRNTRQKTKQKRNLSLATREVRALQASLYRTHITLLAVLGQQGGDVTVTKATFDHVLKNARTMNWESKPGQTDQEFEVRLITVGDTASTVAPAVEITKVVENAEAATEVSI